MVLTGGLGAGKTTLTQGIGEGLGVRGPVTSPTFVIARVHPSTVGGPALVHVDAYRLGGSLELDDLDLDASVDDSVTVVEWGHGLAEDLSEDRLEVVLDVDTATEVRTATVTGIGGRWSGEAADAGLVALGGAAVLLLAIDTSTSAITVACYARRRAGRRGATSTPGRTPRSWRRWSRDTLAAAGATPADLTDIAVGTGPGPFTGLRVGLVTALTWATPSASRCTASAASTRSPSRRWRSAATSRRCSSPPTRAARRSTGRAYGRGADGAARGAR